MDLVHMCRQLRICHLMAQFNLRQYQVDLIPWFQRYCVSAEYDQYDDMCDRPGQDINCVIDDLPPVGGDAAAIAEMEAKTNEGHELRMEFFSEMLDEIDHVRLKKQFTAEYNPMTKPADVTIMKELYGYAYTPETCPTVFAEF